LLADLFINIQQTLAQLSEAVKLRNLILRLSQSDRSSEGLCGGFAADLAGETKKGPMTGVSVFVAMTTRVPATAGRRSNRAGAQVAQSANLAQNLGAS
jgi:hypothetical protein